MLSLIVFIIILGVLVIVHEFGHFIAAKQAGVKVEIFSLGFGKCLFKWKKKETEYLVCAVPLGGYVKLSGDNLEEYKGNPDDYLAQSAVKRFSIIFCGPLLNYVLGFLCFWLIFFIGYPTLTSRVGTVIDDFPAKEAGIKSGDLITAIDGQKVELWEDIQGIIQEKRANLRVNISLLRGDRPLTLEVKIKEDTGETILGDKRKAGFIGITPSGEIKKIKHGFIESWYLSLRRTYDLTILTYKALWRIITGKLSMRESVTGPLGMFDVTSKAVKLGLAAILHLVAALNISLAIFNLLPFPALDGGHLLFLLVEKIRGKYLSSKAEKIVTRVGFSFLISVGVLVFYNDIIRLGWIDKIYKLFIK